MEKNYHSRLLLVSERFDSVIEKLKTSYIDEKYQLAWWLWLLTAPVRDFAKVKDFQKGIDTFFKSSAFLAILPFLTAFGGYVVSLFYPFSIPFPEWTVTAISFLFGYIANMFIYFPLLINYKSEHFHTGAYRLFRRQEYDLFLSSFLDDKGDFYFKGLYDYVTNSTEGQRTIATLINNGKISVESLLNNFLQNERTNYESRIFHLEEKLNESTNIIDQMDADFDEFTQTLISERGDLHQEFEYVIELLKDINTLLFRIHNKGISVNDLDILTGFTLYELKGNTLIQKADVRTSGSSPRIIKLDDPTYSHYGVVKVINEDLSRPYFNHPYPGHVVVSYKMRVDCSGTWVYNFHFDSSNLKAWKLLVENGIIESKEIYRLVHALSLLTLNFEENTSTEGAVNQ